jgi:hypothetical protein
MTTLATELAVSLGLAVPLSYFVSCRSRDQTAHIYRQAYVVVLWSIFLSIPFRHHEELPVHKAVTMMTAVFTFIIPLKLTQLVLYPDYADHAKKNKEETANLTTTKSKSLSWNDFFLFCKELFYYAYPMSKTIPKRRTWVEVAKLVAEYVSVAFVKAMISPFLGTAILHFSQTEPDPASRSWTTYYILCLLFLSQVVAGTWGLDLQIAAVSVASGGYYEGLPFNNYVFWSTSLSDFWGHRYNRLINTLLKDTVYKPLLVYDVVPSKDMASLATFFVSGILHSHVAYFTFGRGVVKACLFFVVHHYLIQLEKRVVPTDWPRLVRGPITLLLMLSSFPLYLGLFVDAMPDWEVQNPTPIPFGLAKTVSDFLAQTLLGIDSKQQGSMAT